MVLGQLVILSDKELHLMTYIPTPDSSLFQPHLLILYKATSTNLLKSS